ncbi:MAG: cation transporter [bacterium]|nr:cation transporter [bacterium]
MGHPGHDHHHHGHGHDHGHGHHHGTAATTGRAFLVGIVLNGAFVAVEAGAGLVTGSLALLADAGHNLSDVLGLLLAWGANRLARRAPSLRRTYGWRRSSIMAALLNAVLLLVAVGGIAWEAIRRAQEPTPVPGATVMIVAGIGFVINAATALLFLSSRKHDLNARGAFLHMAADAAVSLGVVAAGAAIVATGWAWLDPAVSLVIAVVILFGTWGLLKESLDLSLDAVPVGIDAADVRACLAALPGVTAVHDLHVWAMSTTEVALTAHLVKPDPGGDDALIARATHELGERFGIAHVTLQWERAGNDCPSAPCAPGPQ